MIYLKSLFSKFKSNEKLSEELKIEMAKLNLNVDAYNNKPIGINTAGIRLTNYNTI